MHLPFLSAVLLLSAAQQVAPAPAQLDRAFAKEVVPALTQHCLPCHGGGEKIRGGFDLRPFASPRDVAGALQQWDVVLEQLRSGDMPPEDEPQPSPAQRQQVMRWIEGFRLHEARRNDGDPGPVLARRLSNAEYDYTIRDLTGVDLRPAKDFPIDPANEAGFDNSGESLTTSPALLQKYVEAARKVADHLVLGPTRLWFAPHEVVTDTGRDKLCVNRVVDFYKRQPTDLAAYFCAAWKHERQGGGEGQLARQAARHQLSANYLKLVWQTLHRPGESMGPIAALQAMWKALPPESDAKRLEQGCAQLRDFVIELRGKTKVVVPNLRVNGMNPGAQALVLWKDRQMAASRRSYGGGALNLRPAELTDHPAARRALTAPRGLAGAAAFEHSFVRFAKVFPDTFYVSERARVFLTDESEDKGNVGRLLSAGFHNQMGYFRDDQPLYELILTEAQRKQLDELWWELDFVTGAPMRQHASLIWFERSESRFLREPAFDFARAEDKDIALPEKFDRFAAAYIGKTQRSTEDPVTRAAVQEHFARTRKTIGAVVAARKASEPLHLAALQAFAEKAYRRPLSHAERQRLVKDYDRLRNREGQDHESAMRDLVAAILVSPSFLFHAPPAPIAKGPQPLDSHALASRLSFFLWSSLPDAALQADAAAGRLRSAEVLSRHVRRMLKDPRSRALAIEFGGQWLDFRRFESHNAVDRGVFTTFDSELRQAMFEEPVRFLEDLLRNDGSALDLVLGKHTFVNAALARHYGMPVPEGTQWVRMAEAHLHGRGGILPMAVFLTKNAPGLRTSPVKRGNWVVQRVLGERVPPPPATVPELPNDEAAMGEMTLREALARHREDKSCSGCHNRIDGFGLAFEGYGPIGERRNKDLGGRAVDACAPLPGGATVEGLEGLQSYIKSERQQDFVNQLSRKLLAYALGRSLQPSDDLTLTRLRRSWAAQGYRMAPLIEGIVLSRPFINQRGTEP